MKAPEEDVGGSGLAVVTSLCGVPRRLVLKKLEQNLESF